MLEDSYHGTNDASQQASEVGCAFEKEIDWRYVVAVFTMSATELEDGDTDVARIAQSRGVRL